MESKKQQKREAFQDAWRTKRSVTLVYILLRASVILVMLAQIFNRNFENVFLCVLTLFLFMVPSMLERKLDIALPNTLEIIILLFIYRGGDHGRDWRILRHLPLLGHHAPHPERLSLRRHRLLPAGHSQPAHEALAVPPVSAVSGHCGVLLLHDRRRAFGNSLSALMDQLFLLDMQKDTVVHTIGSVMLDPTGGNHPAAIHEHH